MKRILIKNHKKKLMKFLCINEYVERTIGMYCFIDLFIILYDRTNQEFLYGSDSSLKIELGKVSCGVCCINVAYLILSFDKKFTG